MRSSMWKMGKSSLEQALFKSRKSISDLSIFLFNWHMFASHIRYSTSLIKRTFIILSTSTSTSTLATKSGACVSEVGLMVAYLT